MLLYYKVISLEYSKRQFEPSKGGKKGLCEAKMKPLNSNDSKMLGLMGHSNYLEVQLIWGAHNDHVKFKYHGYTFCLFLSSIR